MRRSRQIGFVRSGDDEERGPLHVGASVGTIAQLTVDEPPAASDECGHGNAGLDALRLSDGFWYVATPYSKYPGGIHAAFNAACRFTAKLIQAGVPVYSPIAHTHPIAMAGEIDPLDHSIWLPADKPMMDAAHGLIVATLPTWQTSYGVSEEIRTFLTAGKLVHYIDPETIN